MKFTDKKTLLGAPREARIFTFLLIVLLALASYNFISTVKANPTFTARTETYVNLSSLTTPFNITVTKPDGTVDGDILFCWIAWYITSVTIDSVPSGWTLLGESIVAEYSDRYALYYKIASNEPVSWVWSFTATAKVRAVCSCYTSGDFNASDPIDVFSNISYKISDTNCKASSMNVTAINSPLVFWGGVYYASPKTFTKPSVPTTDWVEDDDAGSTTPDFWTEVCSMIWTGSGATGDMVSTISADVSSKHAFAVALNPPSEEKTWNNAETWKLNIYALKWFVSELWKLQLHNFSWFNVESWKINIHNFAWFISESWNIHLHNYSWFLSENWLINLHNFSWFDSEIWKLGLSTLVWNLAEIWKMNIYTYGWFVSEIWKLSIYTFSWLNVETWLIQLHNFAWFTTEIWKITLGNIYWYVAELWSMINFRIVSINIGLLYGILAIMISLIAFVFALEKKREK